jgi:hypothetical protein
MTPPCERCGFDIDTAENFRNSQHMLLVQALKPTHRDDPPSARVAARAPTWVCGHCHAPRETILRVVERRSAVSMATVARS